MVDVIRPTTAVSLTCYISEYCYKRLLTAYSEGIGVRTIIHIGRDVVPNCRLSMYRTQYQRTVLPVLRAGSRKTRVMVRLAPWQLEGLIVFCWQKRGAQQYYNSRRLDGREEVIPMIRGNQAIQIHSRK
jgi:hypothetical protein